MTSVGDALRGLRNGAGAALAAGLLACASGGPPEPPRMCLAVESSSRLNFFAGQSHILVLHVYPLASALTFESLNVQDLLSGAKFSGTTGERQTLEIEPAQTIALTEPLPRDTVSLGLVADFYGAPQKAIVSAACGFFGGEKIVLSSNDLQVAP